MPRFRFSYILALLISCFFASACYSIAGLRIGAGVGGYRGSGNISSSTGVSIDVLCAMESTHSGGWRLSAEFYQPPDLPATRQTSPATVVPTSPRQYNQSFQPNPVITYIMRTAQFSISDRRFICGAGIGVVLQMTTSGVNRRAAGVLGLRADLGISLFETGNIIVETAVSYRGFPIPDRGVFTDRLCLTLNLLAKSYDRSVSALDKRG